MKIADKSGGVREDDVIDILEFSKSKKGGWDYAGYPGCGVDDDREINFKVKDSWVDIQMQIIFGK